MCWNFEVSVAFAVAESLLFVTILILPESRKYWRIAPILLTIIAVEAAEAAIWKTGVEPKISRLSYHDTCPVTNRFMMWIIIMAVAVQPIFSSWYVFKASMLRGSNRNLQVEKYSLLLGYLIFVGILNAGSILIRLILAEASPDTFKIIIPLKELTEGSGYTNANSTDNILEKYPNSLIYSESCAYVGDNGHLHWQWGLTYAKYAPNYIFIYLLIGSTSGYYLYILVDKIEAVIWVFFFLLLFLWVVLLGDAEGSSMWCWSGILIHLFYLVYPHMSHIVNIMKCFKTFRKDDKDGFKTVRKDDKDGDEGDYESA